MKIKPDGRQQWNDQKVCCVWKPTNLRHNPYITEGNLHPVNEEDFEIPTYVVPFDDEGYVQAFDFDEDQNILDFFHKYGFVVIKDVLSAEGL